MSQDKNEQDNLAEEGAIQRIHAAYLEYNKTLRAWFVGYGVGVPILLLTQGHLLDKVSKSGRGPLIGYFFLSGVGVQVLMAFLNKWSNWYRYVEKTGTSGQSASMVKLAKFIRDYPGVDVFADILASILFAFATALTFRAILL